MASEKSNKWYGFWKTMKQGYDYFEKYRIPPSVTVCERRYVVDAVPAAAPILPDVARLSTGRSSRPLRRLPEPAEMDVASGNKLKGIANPDNEPTLAEIKTAKQQQSAIDRFDALSHRRFAAN